MADPVHCGRLRISPTNIRWLKQSSEPVGLGLGEYYDARGMDADAVRLASRARSRILVEVSGPRHELTDLRSGKLGEKHTAVLIND